MSFGTFLKAYRRNLDLNLHEFCAGVGQYVPAGERYSIITVNRWERDKFTPPVTWLHWLHTHAPADSWQYDFAQRSMELLAINCGGPTDKAQPRADNEQLSI